MCLGLSSCGGKPVSYNADFWTTDSSVQAIVSEDAVYIYTNDIEFEDYICTHYERIDELANILAVAKVPWWYSSDKKKIVKDIKENLKKLRPH